MLIISRSTNPLSYICNTFRYLNVKPSKEDPKIPKKPNTPWVSYYVKTLPTFREKYPSDNISDLMRKASQKWKSVPESEKSQLQSAYIKEKE